MLSDEGKLSLDDDITLYLPNYPTHGQTITIEQLLTHTGGVKDFEFLPSRLAVSRNDLTVAELMALFQDEPLDLRRVNGGPTAIRAMCYWAPLSKLYRG